MAKKAFTQEELNRIVAARLGREQERLTKEFEDRLKRCMAAVHLTLYQEMCSLKREIDAETNDTLMSDLTEISKEQPSDMPLQQPTQEGGEQQ